MSAVPVNFLISCSDGHMIGYKWGKISFIVKCNCKYVCYRIVSLLLGLAGFLYFQEKCIFRIQILFKNVKYELKISHY